MDDSEKQALFIRVGRAFSPFAPIDQSALFAGRTAQLGSVMDALVQRGRHAVIFGERGVGKTSLASILREILMGALKGVSIMAPRVNCDTTDSYLTIWQKICGEMTITEEHAAMGLVPRNEVAERSLREIVPDDITPDWVRRTLTTLATHYLVIIIIDEFERVRDADTRLMFSDTVKTLSDHSVGATLVLVGVAEDVQQLIHEHESIERALVQVRMPRMSRHELNEIVEPRLKAVDMGIEREALEYISALSQGLPHYAHLIGLYAGRTAIGRDSMTVTVPDIDGALNDALGQVQESVRQAYYKATMSPRDNLYPQVLLACALARLDDLNYFAAADVRGPMTRIMGRPYDIPAFSRHLNDFCEDRRGKVLEKTGTPRRYKFRFFNPLMRPFVVMRGLGSGLITRDGLE